jgi:GDP-4-dehydro-6-deoxy-D-mannose reductase
MIARGWSVTAAGISHGTESRILSDDERHAVDWVTMDVTDGEQIAAALDRAAPDVVLHLAAISHVPDAKRNPARAFEVNAVGTVRLLAQLVERRREGRGDPMVVVVGSSEQYGRHDRDEMPLDERAEQRPLTLYASSKAAQEMAALQAFRGEGLRVVCTRSFNHSGAGQAPSFVLPGLVTRGLAVARDGGPLTLGNGDTVRDFLHVHDVVNAYLSLADRGIPGEVYNVCSGEGVSIRALAESVLQRIGVPADISSDPTLTRPVDVPVQIGSNAKLRRATGWTPRRTREDIIDDLIHAATR